MSEKLCDECLFNTRPGMWSPRNCFLNVGGGNGPGANCTMTPEALAIFEALIDETFMPKLLWHLAEINAWLQAEFYWSLRDERVRFSIPVEDTTCPKCGDEEAEME